MHPWLASPRNPGNGLWCAASPFTIAYRNLTRCTDDRGPKLTGAERRLGAALRFRGPCGRALDHRYKTRSCGRIWVFVFRNWSTGRRTTATGAQRLTTALYGRPRAVPTIGKLCSQILEEASRGCAASPTCHRICRSPHVCRGCVLFGGIKCPYHSETFTR